MKQIPFTVRLAPRSMGFPRQEYWSWLPSPFPGDLPNQGWNLCLLCLLHWQVDSLSLSHRRIYSETEVKSESRSLQPHGLSSPGQNTGAGSLSLFRGIFPTQRSNPGFPHLQADSLPAEPQRRHPKSSISDLTFLGREGGDRSSPIMH